MIILFSAGYTLDELTLGTVDLLESGIRCVLRTEKCAAAEYMKLKSLPYETLDSFYTDNDAFSDLNEKSAGYVRTLSRDCRVALGVFSPDTDSLAGLLREDIEGCVPYADRRYAFWTEMTGNEIRECSAVDVKAENAQGDLIITEIDSRLTAGDLKLKLTEFYSEQSKVFMQTDHGEKRSIVLEDLDRQPDRMYGHRCQILIPDRSFLQKTRFDFTDLKHVMECLRAPGGCPWDQSQDHHSLRSYLIEEAYETASAIDAEDWEHAADELGDVLLQVVFQADIGKQYGTFTLGDITSAICSKMIRRHEHVFGSSRDTEQSVLSQRWEDVKNQEQHNKTVTESMRSLAQPLPAMMKAEKILRKAAVALTEKQSTEDALKLAEEKLRNVRDALQAGKSAEAEDSLGNLLLACVNLTRIGGIESEVCLLRAVERFVRRFEIMEQMVEKDKLSLKNLTIEEIRVYWSRAMRLSGA